MKLKVGVKYDGLSPEMWVAAGFAWAAYQQLAPGKECVITSALDGTHSAKSLHYTGNAIDLRTRELTENETIHIHLFLQQNLGPLGWDVVMESDHFHAEWQPKGAEQFIRWVS